MDVMCPYCHRYYRVQEKQCISKNEVYVLAIAAQPNDETYIFFRPPFDRYNGIYHIQAIAGEPQNFIILAKNLSNQDFKFTSDQICDMHFMTYKVQSNENINHLTAPECKTCWYNGVQYSPGAFYNNKMCGTDGIWH